MTVTRYCTLMIPTPTAPIKRPREMAIGHRRFAMTEQTLESIDRDWSLK